MRYSFSRKNNLLFTLKGFCYGIYHSKYFALIGSLHSTYQLLRERGYVIQRYQKDGICELTH